MVGKEIEDHSPTTAQEPSITHPYLDQVRTLDHNYHVKQRNSKIIKFLSSFGILITIEAILIELRRILWHYEAKTRSTFLMKTSKAESYISMDKNRNLRENGKLSVKQGLKAVKGILIISHDTVLQSI